MSWTPPRTWVAGEQDDASLMNTHIRDQFNEMAAAKVTTAGDLVYATGANALTRLGIGANGTYLLVSGSAPAWGTPTRNTIVPKTADESVTSSTSPQADDHLTAPIAASKILLLRYRLIFHSGSTGGLSFDLAVPSGATGFLSSFAVAGNVRIFTTSIGSAQNAGVAADDEVWIEAVIVNSTNAGNVVLQWAQNSSNGTASTLKAWSTVEYRVLN